MFLTHGAKTRVLGWIFFAIAARNASGQSATSSTWGFISGRASSTVSHYIYTGFGYRRAFVMAALIQNPRSAYTESLAGAGLRFRVGAHTQFVAVAASRATEASYAEIYYVPAGAIGSVTLSSTLELGLPYTQGGARQLAMTSATALVPVTRVMSLGVIGDAAISEGTRGDAGVGPAIAFAVAPGRILFAGIKGITNYADELRATFAAFY